MKISEILERERKSENGREAVEYNRERERVNMDTSAITL
jgi:hypothetical protein